MRNPKMKLNKKLLKEFINRSFLSAGSMNRLCFTLVLAGLLGMVCTYSPRSIAQQSDAEDQWGDWQSLGEGYVARRKVPVNLDKEVTSRRTKNVQSRLERLQIQLQRQLSRLENMQAGSGDQNRIRRTKSKIAILEKRIQKKQRVLLTSQADQIQPSALWLRTDTEGLYAVPLIELAAELQINPNVFRRKVKRGRLNLDNAGLPASWHYDSTSDNLWFVGERYETFHTEQNAYWLKLGSKRDAQPMLLNDDAPTDATGFETPFMDLLKFEEEPDMNFFTWTVASEPDADYWFWDYLYGGFKDLIEVPLIAPHPAQTGAAQIRIRLRGWTDLYEGDEHHVSAEINGVSIGSVLTWDGFEEAILIADFDQSLLDPSGNNSLRLRNVSPTGTTPGQFLDDVELEYARLPVSSDGKLWLHGVAPGVQSVSGFSSGDIVVIESPDGEAIIRADARIDPDLSGGHVVTFEAQGGTDFLITERSVVSTPIVQVDIPSDLKKGENAADYLIISPRDFTGTAEALAQFRSSRYSQTMIVWLDDIYDEFSFGREDPFAIPNFMNHVNTTWSAVPSNVLLIGKGTLDHKDRMGYSDSFLPVIFTDTPWALAASDDRLLGGNGDAPFAFGRLPITSDEQGLAYVEKLTLYENSLPGNQTPHAVLVADNPDDGGNFHLNTDLLADRLLDTLGFASATKLYHPQDAVRDQLILSETWEADFVSFDGHGSTSQVGNGSENFLKAADAEVLQNSDRPIFSALTCAVGDSTYPGTSSLASALVLNPDGGAIASLAPTGLSLDFDAQVLGNAFVDNLYGSYNTIGDSILQAKSQTQGVINDFMHRMYIVVGDPAVYAR